MHVKHICIFLCLAFSTGCGAGWHQPENLSAGAMPSRQQVRVWRSGEVARWHAVVVTTDSVSGVRWLAPIDCDSCRVTFPTVEVDSLQIGNPPAGFWKSVGLVLGVISGFLAVFCWGGCGMA